MFRLWKIPERWTKYEMRCKTQRQITQPEPRRSRRMNLNYLSLLRALRSLRVTHSPRKSVSFLSALWDVPEIMRTALLLLTLVPTVSCLAGNWPQFRGPQASGLDSSAATPVHWNIETKENVLWRAPIPGLAHASPIIWSNRVYVATAVSPVKAELKVGLYG